MKLNRRCSILFHAGTGREVADGDLKAGVV